MSFSSSYKPSPLSFGSPRASPFRRPESPSPSSPSTTIRASTPTGSPTKATTPLQSPSKADSPGLSRDERQWLSHELSPTPNRDAPDSPTRMSTAARETRESPLQSRPATAVSGGTNECNNNALSKLGAEQVRELREGFQLLDRDSDGQVTREDVVEMLNSLGQDSSARSVTKFFSPSTPHPLTLPPFLTNLSTLLAPISASDELLSAFAAFDEDDNGTIDVNEMRSALIHTAPEVRGDRSMTEVEVDRAMRDFVGKRAFGGNRAKVGGGRSGPPRGDVFKYREFVASVRGSSSTGGPEGQKVPMAG